MSTKTSETNLTRKHATPTGSTPNGTLIKTSITIQKPPDALEKRPQATSSSTDGKQEKRNQPVQAPPSTQAGGNNPPTSMQQMLNTVLQQLHELHAIASKNKTDKTTI